MDRQKRHSYHAGRADQKERRLQTTHKNAKNCRASIPMKHTRLTEKITIKCSPEQAFDYTQDYNQRLRWDTFLKSAEILDGAPAAGPGVKTYCVARNGIGMETRYVSFNRPQTAAVKMTKSHLLFTSFLGSWTFKLIAPGHTEVTFLYAFRLRFPFSLCTRLIKNTLLRNVRQRLSDLKTNMEQQNNSHHNSKTNTQYFRQTWEETTGETLTDAWGGSDWYFETDEHLNVSRQIQVFRSGPILKYDDQHAADDYGALTDQPLDLTEHTPDAITQAEFEELWTKQQENKH